MTFSNTGIVSVNDSRKWYSGAPRNQGSDMRLIFAVIFLLCPLSVSATDVLTVTSAWMRAMPPGAPGAAYVSLRNDGDLEQRVTAASSAQAGRVEIHESVKSGDRWRMQQLAVLSIPASGQVNMQPGGTHIMLFDLVSPLQEGDSLELKLVLESGATVPVIVDVRSPEGAGGHHHHH